MCIVYLYPDGGSSGRWFDADFNLGTLFAQNGAASFVRYADLGAWTGAPIPDPATCPTMGTIQPCGGACGACPANETCYGRSPLHPVGICRPTGSFDCGVGAPCSLHAVSGQSCFTYTVQPEAQSLADTMGMCFSDSDCNAIAASLPGGGKCTQ